MMDAADHESPSRISIFCPSANPPAGLASGAAQAVAASSATGTAKTLRWIANE
jgi:hypothetical protein